MDTKNKGVLTIETDRNNQKKVIFAPINGTVWLTKCELTELFGVYRQTVNAAIDTILKTGVPDVEETTEYHLIAKTGKNKIGYEPYKFNLVFVVAMASRIDSENAEVLRKWIISRMLLEKSVFLPILITTSPNYIWN